jgi:hypothetical protein
MSRDNQIINIHHRARDASKVREILKRRRHSTIEVKDGEKPTTTEWTAHPDISWDSILRYNKDFHGVPFIAYDQEAWCLYLASDGVSCGESYQDPGGSGQSWAVRDDGFIGQIKDAIMAIRETRRFRRLESRVWDRIETDK